MTIHERIREIREKRGIRSREVAQKLGLYPSAYSNIEKGKRRVHVEELALIAETLGVTFADLAGEKETEGGMIRVPDEVLNDLKTILSSDLGKGALSEFLRRFAREPKVYADLSRIISQIETRTGA